MDNNNQDEFKISTEEANAEAEAQQEVKDDELRAKVAQDLGIDPEDESELLDKIVAREKASHERLSGAIKQKISWRTKAQEASKKSGDTGKGDSPSGDTGVAFKPEDIDKRVEEKLAERDLKDMNLPEEIETLVRNVAKINGISVRDAAKDPYVVAKLSEVEKQKKLEGASPKRGADGSVKISDIDYSKPLNPADFDLNTEEGRKGWKEARAKRDQWVKENSDK